MGWGRRGGRGRGGGGVYFEAIAHGYVTCGEVDEDTGNEERMNFVVGLGHVRNQLSS